MSRSELLVMAVGLVVGFLAVKAFFNLSNRHAAKRRKSDNESSNGKSYTEDTSSEQHDTKERPAKPDFRVFRCPRCSQKTRVRIPLAGRDSQCKKCGARFSIGIDDNGSLHVMSDARSDDDGYRAPRTPEECLALLGLGPVATSEEIRAAYKKRMMEYHPDKVANLGEKLRTVATSETQRLNAAYRFLKERGLPKDG